MKERWLKEFIRTAIARSNMSRDANTKVGAILFDEEDCVEISTGYNCLARGVEHKPERNERPLKYFYTSHAEQSAVASAARLGRSTKGCSALITMFPCPICAALLINAGVKKIYTVAPDWDHYKYGEEFVHSEAQFKDAGVQIEYINQYMKFCELEVEIGKLKSMDNSELNKLSFACYVEQNERLAKEKDNE